MKNEQFEKDILLVPALYNKLEIVETTEENFLKGYIDIVDNVGKLWDRYKVEIRGSRDYPFSFPKLFETGNAFLKIADWHIYEFDDKSCCVDITPNEIIICKQGLNIIDYITRFAIPFLANQTFRIREGYYLYGEYSHGILGRLEFYQSKLKAKSSLELMQMFQLIIKGYDPDRRIYCPFCYKVKFRKCHRTVFKELRLIKEFLAYDMSALLPFFKAHPNYPLPIV